MVKDCMHCKVQRECTISLKIAAKCRLFESKGGKEKLAVRALEHPDSLNKALCSLPFKYDLYLD